MNRSDKLLKLIGEFQYTSPRSEHSYRTRKLEQGTKYAGTAIGPSIPCKIEDQKQKAPRLDSATRRKVSNEVSTLSSGEYYDAIPLKDVFDILAKYGIVALQEDNTEWSGILTGREATVTLPLAPIPSKSSEGFYTPYSNVALHFSYYKMPSNRYEFIVYVN
jgi:hypothetical protein